MPRSDTSEDIISSYGEDRSGESSPTKERGPHGLTAQQRDRDRAQPRVPTTDDQAPSSSSRRKENSSAKRTPAASGKKSDVPFDVIDRLDISGLYGGGGTLAFLSLS